MDKRLLEFLELSHYFRILKSALADCGLSEQGLQFCLPAGPELVQLGLSTWHWRKILNYIFETDNFRIQL